MLPALLALWSGLACAQSLSSDALDNAVRVPRISLGSLKLVGEDHPRFELGDFPITVEGAGVSAAWIDNSLRWMRGQDGLPIPAARMKVAVPTAPEHAYLRWRGRSVLLRAEPGACESSAELLVLVFEQDQAQVVVDGKETGRVRYSVRTELATAPELRLALDNTCSPWHVSVKGLEDALTSVSCALNLERRFGSEVPVVEVRWAAAGVAPPGGGAGAFTIQMRGSTPARLTVEGPHAKSRVVEFTASVPPRWHRLRFAAGAGPYSLSSSATSGNGGAVSAMLYSNFRLRHTDDLSLRAFDAAVTQRPASGVFFNNLGFYFAHDLARVWDGRLALTPLVGMQAVTFAPQGLGHASHSEALYPQGVELSYSDAFGLRGKTLSGGAFLQPTSSQHYSNIWIRFGGRWFFELNVISWRSDQLSAKMSGISVGIPIARIF